MIDLDAPWEPPEIRLAVGDRVRIAQSGECRGVGYGDHIQPHFPGYDGECAEVRQDRVHPWMDGTHHYEVCLLRWDRGGWYPTAWYARAELTRIPNTAACGAG